MCGICPQFIHEKPLINQIAEMSKFKRHLPTLYEALI